MSKPGQISNIEQLREHALETLQKLSAGEIDTTTAGVTGKVVETVISTIKAQLQYAAMLDETPQIEFLQSSHKKRNIIEGKTHKGLLSDK